MKDDPIIQQIRAVRHQISEHYHHNLDELIAHYIELEQRHPERFINVTNHETPSYSGDAEYSRAMRHEPR